MDKTDEVDSLNIFTEYFSWESKLLQDCIRFKLRNTTFKKPRLLFENDFRLISRAALEVADEIKRQKAKQNVG